MHTYISFLINFSEPTELGIETLRKSKLQRGLGLFPVENNMSETNNWSVTVAENELVLMKLLWLRKIIDSEPQINLIGNDDSKPYITGDIPQSKWSLIWGRAIESVYLFHTNRMLIINQQQLAPELMELEHLLGANQKDFAIWLNNQTPVAGQEPFLSKDLENAWRAGLRLVISLPWEEEKVQKYNPETLILSDSIRANSSKYQETLKAFSLTG